MPVTFRSYQTVLCDCCDSIGEVVYLCVYQSKGKQKLRIAYIFRQTIFLGRQCCSLLGICVLEVYVVMRIRGIMTVHIVVNVY